MGANQGSPGRNGKPTKQSYLLGSVWDGSRDFLYPTARTSLCQEDNNCFILPTNYFHPVPLPGQPRLVGRESLPSTRHDYLGQTPDTNKHRIASKHRLAKHQTPLNVCFRFREALIRNQLFLPNQHRALSCPFRDMRGNLVLGRFELLLLSEKELRRDISAVLVENLFVTFSPYATLVSLSPGYVVVYSVV